LHGGRVEAHSEGLGKGSEFIVRLPVVRIAESKCEPAAPYTTPGDTPAKSFRILVVDDNEDAAESLVTLLKLDGHDVCVAYDGLSAVESARGFRPQVVLLDIGLPDVNGYEVADRLRSFDETKDAFLIAVTGYGRTEDRVRALTGGFNYHVTKPVNPDEMDAIIRTTAFTGFAGASACSCS
jgi:CheY-like chemotaxis protein